MPETHKHSKSSSGHSNLLDTKKDIWDVGILTYELLFGKIPVFVQSQEGQPAQVDRALGENSGVYFPEEVSFSPQLQDFVEGCLQQNPYKRYTLRQLGEHAFLNGADKYRWTTF
jgi:serine/threonine protein kinase